MPDIYLIEYTCRSYWITANSKSYLPWLFKLALNIKEVDKINNPDYTPYKVELA